MTICHRSFQKKPLLAKKCSITKRHNRLYGNVTHMSSDTDNTFQQRLIEKRNERELNQSELARKAGLQPSAIAHFEAGRRKPSFANIRALAKALNTSADYLLGSDTGVTAFRDEDKLSNADRNFIQSIINMRVKEKFED